MARELIGTAASYRCKRPIRVCDAALPRGSPPAQFHGGRAEIQLGPRLHTSLEIFETGRSVYNKSLMHRSSMPQLSHIAHSHLIPGWCICSLRQLSNEAGPLRYFSATHLAKTACRCVLVRPPRSGFGLAGFTELNNRVTHPSYDRGPSLYFADAQTASIDSLSSMIKELRDGGRGAF